VLLLAEVNRLGWLTSKREISTDQCLLFLCAVSDRGQHVSTLMGNVNHSRDQVSFKLGGTLAGDVREAVGDALQIKTASRGTESPILRCANPFCEIRPSVTRGLGMSVCGERCWDLLDGTWGPATRLSQA